LVERNSGGIGNYARSFCGECTAVVLGIDINPHHVSPSIFKKSNFCGSRTFHRVL
jgi:hypothetical protein